MKRPIFRKSPPDAFTVERLLMKGRVRPIGTLVTAGFCVALLMGVLLIVAVHSSHFIDPALITGSATALSDTTKPTANAGPDQSVSVGERVRFNASLSTDTGGSIANYTWSFFYDTRDMRLYGAEPNFTFEKAGQYDVTLNVTDGAGLYDSDLVVIKVAAEKAGISSLIYSGGAAAVVAALLVILFIVMRNSKGNGGKEEPADSSEEEFEEA